MQHDNVGGRWDFFVSYTHADQAWAEWIAWQLEEDRYRVLLQAWDMLPGTDWTALMQAGVQGADRTIAVLSPDYLTSLFAAAEWEAAWRDDPAGDQRKLLAFRVADCDRPGLLGGVVSVDLFGVTKAVARTRLRDAISAAITGRAKPAAEPAFPPGAAGARAVAAEPRFPGALPDVWNVPPHNPNFTGRSTELDQIHAWLTDQPTVTVHALHGMGGVGKTQIVIEYAYRHAADYDLVWWINAEQATAIADQFADLAAELGLPALTDPAATVRAVRHALRTRGRWLLIFDNADSAQDIGPLLPGGAGHVLITTRRGGFLDLGDVLDLDILRRPDAIALLCRRAPAVTEDQAGRLAARLGDLALAVDQAAAYLDQTDMPAEDYLRLLDVRSADLHSRGHVAGHSGTVATVWSVSIEEVQAAEPAAVQLLALCAWLAPDPIPLDLFTGHCDQLPEPLASAAADPVAFNDTVGALVDYSLARRGGGDLTIHRLIQEVTRNRSGQPGAGASEPEVTVLALLRADLPDQVWATPPSWPRWQALLPSVLAATSQQAGPPTVPAAPDAAENTAWLLSHAGTYLRSQGRYAAALPLHQRALDIRTAAYGSADQRITADLNDVGWTLTELGRATEALPLHQRALRISEAAFGPDALEVGTDLDYVGGVLSGLGRAGEALPLHQRALRIKEAALSPDDPDIATSLDFTGGALSEVGRPSEALPLHERALLIRETALGPDHPDVSADLTNVGRTLLDLHRAAEALPLHQRALEIDEASVGPDHPTVALDLHWVGRALSELGRDAEALPLHQRALRIRMATLGPDHPQTLQSRGFVTATQSPP